MTAMTAMGSKILYQAIKNPNSAEPAGKRSARNIGNLISNDEI